MTTKSRINVPEYSTAAFEAIREDAGRLHAFIESSAEMRGHACRDASELYHHCIWAGPASHDVLFSYELQGRMIGRAESLVAAYIALNPSYFEPLKPWHAHFVTTFSNAFAPISDTGIIITCTGAAYQRSVMRIEFDIAHPRRSHACIDLEPGVKIGMPALIRCLPVLDDDAIERSIREKLDFIDRIELAERTGDRAVRALYDEACAADMASDDPVHERLYRAMQRFQFGSVFTY